MNATTSVSVALAVALITGFVTLVIWLLNRPKTDAETSALKDQSWSLVNTSLNTEVTRLSARGATQQTEIEGLRREIADLRTQDAAKTERLVSVEEEVVELRALRVTLRQAFVYIRALLDWGRAGGGEQPPEPPDGFVLPDDYH